MKFDVKESLGNYRLNLLEVERAKEESKALITLERRMQYFKDSAGREKLVQLRMLLADNAKKQNKECKNAIRVIKSIKDDRVKTMFKLRYINGEGWDEIAQKMNYDIDSKAVYKIHAGVLKSLCAKYGRAN